MNLNEQIATQIMGWIIEDHPEKNGTGQWMSEYAFPVYRKPNGQYTESLSFRPADEDGVEATHEVIYEMRRKGYNITISAMGGYYWYCKFEIRGDLATPKKMSRNPQAASAPEFGEAVCLAAMNCLK